MAHERVGWIEYLPEKSNIVGFGYGCKTVEQKLQLEVLALRVYVRKKLSLARLDESQRIPPSINGLPTDVIDVGDIRAAGPPQCGECISRPQKITGTLGCLLKRDGESSEDRFILSNHHVLCDFNGGTIGQRMNVSVGSGVTSRRMVRVEIMDFEPIDPKRLNRIDAAIARLIDPNDVSPEILGIGVPVAPIIPPRLAQSVKKRGCGTTLTDGNIVDVSADVKVSYSGGTAWFEDQLAVEGKQGNFADRGDSGSLVVDESSRRAVGLLFAVGQQVSFVNPIEEILRRFSMEVVSQ